MLNAKLTLDRAAVATALHTPSLLEMDVLVEARKGSMVVSPGDKFCRLREADAECDKAVESFKRAYVNREAEIPSTPGVPNSIASMRTGLTATFEDSGSLHGRLMTARSASVSEPALAARSAPASGPAIASARYKLAHRVDEQARQFPALEAEVAARRARLTQKPRDQKSADYKAEICRKVQNLKLCPPAFYDVLCERIVCPFSDRFWDEGCPAPSIKGFKAHIDMKPGKEPRFRQPYRLSRYDETRLKFLFEEAEHEGKQVRYELGEQPPRMCTPCFIVEKKGSLIGRKVGDFQMFNQLTEDYYYPAPDAEAVLLEACGQKFHSLFDCVWGFEQIDLYEESSVLCSTITPFGVYRPKKLPMGLSRDRLSTSTCRILRSSASTNLRGYDCARSSSTTRTWATPHWRII